MREHESRVSLRADRELIAKYKELCKEEGRSMNVSIIRAMKKELKEAGVAYEQ